MDAIRPSRLGSELDYIDWIWVSSLITSTFAIVFASAIGASVLIGCSGPKRKKKTDTRSNDVSKDEDKKDKGASVMKTVSKQPTVDHSEDNNDEKQQKSKDCCCSKESEPPVLPGTERSNWVPTTSGVQSVAQLQAAEKAKEEEEVIAIEYDKEAADLKKKKKKHKKDKKKKKQDGQPPPEALMPKSSEKPKTSSGDVSAEPAKKLTSDSRDEVGVEMKGSSPAGDVKKESEKIKTEASDYKSAKTNVEKTEDNSKFKTVRADA